MTVIRGGAVTSPHSGPSAVTLGSFDGFHRGHARLIERLVDGAARAGATPAALLFVHPRSSAGESGDTRTRLSSLRERLEHLRSGGVRLVLLERSPGLPLADDSVRRLARHLLEIGTVRLVLDSEVEMGVRAVEGSEIARVLTTRLRVPAEILDRFETGGLAVTTRAIREAVSRGALALAAEMLGRSYRVSGRVVHGHHRGKGIGVPTANLRLRGFQLPPDGVYAVRTRLDERVLLGVANLGYNPTFGDTARSLEVHLFDFDGDVYGRRIEVTFVDRLRGERKFPGVPELIDQIRRDIAAARRVLGAP
jgi:riboflavin kinase/FMN adenylyltransferase